MDTGGPHFPFNSHFKTADYCSTHLCFHYAICQIINLQWFPISKFSLSSLSFTAPAFFPHHCPAFTWPGQWENSWFYSLCSSHQYIWVLFPTATFSFLQHTLLENIFTYFESLSTGNANHFCYQTKQNIDSNVNLLQNELFISDFARIQGP